MRFLSLFVETKLEGTSWGESCVPSEGMCVAPSHQGSCPSPGL